MYNNLTGLPSNTIYNILQDKTGFIWLAHDKGLCRYDGKQFKNYNANTEQGKSLSNLMLINGTVWCQDFAGNFYFVEGDSLQQHHYFKTPGAFSIAGFLNNQHIVSVKADSIRKLNIKTKQYASFVNTENTQAASFFADSTVFFVSNNGIKQYMGNGIPSIAIPRLQIWPTNTFFLKKVNTRFYAISKQTQPYIYAIEKNNVQIINTLPAGLFIQEVTVIDKEIWVSTSNGAYCFDTNFNPKYNGHCFFKGTSITGIIKDKEGSYWIGTLNKGLLYISNINTVLYQYNSNAITTLGLYNNQSILAGTSANELLLFNRSTNTYQLLYKQPANHEVVSIFYNAAKNEIVTASDKLWILKQNKIVAQKEMSGKSITSIQDNLLAVGYASGLALVNTTEQASSSAIPGWLNNHYQLNSSKKFFVIDSIKSRVRSVAYHKALQTLYIGSTNGLYLCNQQACTKLQFKQKDIYASHIIEYNNKIYVATFKDEVFEITNNAITNYFVLGNKSAIYKLQKNNNWLWLIGDDFIQKFHTQTKEKITYTAADGLPKAEFKDILWANGKIYVATTLGVVVLNENENSINTTPPTLAINTFTVNNAPYLHTQKHYLPSDSNNINIHFSLLAFKGNEKQLVQYQINNEGWQNVSTTTDKILLPALTAGNYMVQLRAFNEDGIATQTPIAISFSIAAPFYKTIWFIALVILICMGIVYIYFKQKLQRQQQQNNLLAQKIKLEQALQQSMMASIKSQMNPHFLFNALNTIQSYIYTNEKENASEYLGKFSELTRMILEMSNKETVSIATEIKALQLYLDLEKQRFEDKLHYQFYIDNAISTETNYIPSMLIQPYIENAIKHGLLHSKTAWQLRIGFFKTANGIKVEIDDNGIGRKRSQQLNQQRNRKHQSFSTEANKKRLEILNKGLATAITVSIIDKEDAQQHALGTTVLLHIPFL